MPTLAEVALKVAKNLSRVNAQGTSITDLEGEIKDEIAASIRYYNRQPWHLTEVRGLTITTVAQTTWYTTASAGLPPNQAEGLQDLEPSPGNDPRTIRVNDILRIKYMREGGTTALTEPMKFMPYDEFETFFEGATPVANPTYYTRYAGQIGVFPTPDAAYTLYLSAEVKPVVPTGDNDTSIWLDEAEDMIEADATKRVLVKHIRDGMRAAEFAALEQVERVNLMNEHRLKTASGRVKAYI